MKVTITLESEYEPGDLVVFHNYGFGQDRLFVGLVEEVGTTRFYNFADTLKVNDHNNETPMPLTRKIDRVAEGSFVTKLDTLLHPVALARIKNTINGGIGPMPLLGIGTPSAGDYVIYRNDGHGTFIFEVRRVAGYGCYNDPHSLMLYANSHKQPEVEKQCGCQNFAVCNSNCHILLPEEFRHILAKNLEDKNTTEQIDVR